jgi:hypothetical protein
VRTGASGEPLARLAIISTASIPKAWLPVMPVMLSP